jgi:hypothetical protein
MRDGRSRAGRRLRHRRITELGHFTFWTLNLDARKKHSDTWLIFTRYLVGEPNHPGPTIASSAAIVQTGAAAATSAAWTSAMTPITTAGGPTFTAATAASATERRSWRAGHAWSSVFTLIRQWAWAGRSCRLASSWR